MASARAMAVCALAFGITLSAMPAAAQSERERGRSGSVADRIVR